MRQMLTICMKPTLLIVYSLAWHATLLRDSLFIMIQSTNSVDVIISFNYCYFYLC